MEIAEFTYNVYSYFLKKCKTKAEAFTLTSIVINAILRPAPVKKDITPDESMDIDDFLAKYVKRGNK